MKTGLQLLRDAEQRSGFISAADWDTVDFGSERRAQIARAIADAGVNFRIARRRLGNIRADYNVAAAERDLAFHHRAARLHLRRVRKLGEIGRVG